MFNGLIPKMFLTEDLMSLIEKRYKEFNYPRNEEAYEIIEKINKYNLDVNQQDDKGHTPLRKVIDSSTYLPHGDTILAESLLGVKGINPDLADKEGNTPLHVAADKGQISMVKLLLKYKAVSDSNRDYDIQNEEGNTPLHVAALNKYIENEHIEIVKLLLQCEAKLDIQNKEGNTPLHLAAYNKDKETVELLLKHGAKCDIQNKEGNTPLHLAVYNKDKETVELLLKHGAKCDIQNKEGNTPLHLAVYNKDKETVELLLKHGAKCDIQNKEGNTPLHMATHLQCKDIVLLLLDAEANPNIENQSSLTPLCIATSCGDTKIVRLLLGGFESSIDQDQVKKKNSNGNTLLHYAAYGKNTKMVQLLLMDYGADSEATNQSGETPLDIVNGWKNPEVILPNFRLAKMWTLWGKSVENNATPSCYTSFLPHELMDQLTAFIDPESNNSESRGEGMPSPN